MTPTSRPSRRLRRWWHHLEHDTRQRIVGLTVHATVALFGLGSLVLCVVALRTL